MKSIISNRIGLAGLFMAGLVSFDDCSAAVFAIEVVNYVPGKNVTLTDASSSLGQPGPVVGKGSGFDSVLSPFNPHYESSHITQIGESGSLTLRLSHFAVTTSIGPEIGIFTNVGISDQGWPGGIASSDLSLEEATFGIDSARIEVSANGKSWTDLGLLRIDQPSNAFTNAESPHQPDTDGLTETDFGLPHSNDLKDFSGKDWEEIKELLGNSAGGYWIDIDQTELERVGWVRISVPDDGDPSTSLNFEIDAISVANVSTGPALVPEPSVLALVGLGIILLFFRRR